MPVKYTELSAEEMVYDGGVWNFVAAVVCSVASFGCSVMAEITGDDRWESASWVLTGASLALSFGAMGIVGKAGTKAATKFASKVAAKIFNPTNMSMEGYRTVGNIASILSFPTDLTGGIFIAKGFF
ncbi:MAG: hypothetical protein FWH44_03350 [Methanomassiliicoccaceae archaeon]|nr:hypothetical protein [Methanomassiliicoccaceae archaeon]